MKKPIGIFLILTAAIFFAGAPGGYAHGKFKSKSKHAAHELKEAKHILLKLTPDTDGHVAKASALIDQAIQELSAVKG